MILFFVNFTRPKNNTIKTNFSTKTQEKIYNQNKEFYLENKKEIDDFFKKYQNILKTFTKTDKNIRNAIQES